MTIFEIVAIVLCFAAIGGYLNHRFVGLPGTIGQMAFALLLSLLAVAMGELGWLDLDAIRAAVGQVDFSKLLLRGMLCFLLFAGALQIDIDALRSVRAAVAVLATAGVVLATALTGGAMWLVSGWLGIGLPLIYALLFGALIAPTDPIAVLGMLKRAKVSESLHAKIGGESLFNDGAGVTVFIALLGVAMSPAAFEPWRFAGFFLYQGAGGLALGSLLGWAVYRLMLPIDEYRLEALMTLALASGGYALAGALDVSGPLCSVASGLVIGNTARRYAMSDGTRRRLDVFWELIDDILNAALFLLIGLEILVVPLNRATVALGLCAVLIALAARFVSVAVPIGLLRLRLTFERGTIRLLTWGGLRGGLSIAMALSLPPVPEKTVLLAATYIVVLFSILVQGLTFNRLLRAVVVQMDDTSTSSAA